MNSKTFWPLSYVEKSTCRAGYLVGWNLTGFTNCIAVVVPRVKLRDLDRHLERLIQDDKDVHIRHMMKVCGIPPSILGILDATESSFDEYEGNDADSWLDRDEIQLLNRRKRSSTMWLNLTIGPDRKLPHLRSLYCCGYRYTNLDSEIIIFRPPNPYNLQFMSVQPLELDITKLSPKKSNKSAKNAELQKLRLHTLQSQQKEQNSSSFELLINQINCAHYLNNKINQITRMKDSSFVGQVLAFITVRLTTLWSHLEFFERYISWSFLLVFNVFRFFAELVMLVLNFKLHLRPFWDDINLLDISSTGQQIQLRLQQICFWPFQALTFRKKGWRNDIASKSQYISFYNSMWLVANDIIIGLAVGKFLVSQHQFVAAQLSYALEQYGIEILKSTVMWLMGWPAGLKLNSNLDRFLGELFLWLIYIWNDIFVLIKPHLSVIVLWIGFSGMFGMTMIVSLVSDLLNALTLHLYMFYSVQARIYNWQVSALWSLFNLFRGKKYNVLRDRLDSCDYGLDQLLLGTILFTLLFFLFPTILVYYILFCAARLGVLSLQVLLKSFLAALNHFPLFTLMLRVKDPQRLSGGVSFFLIDENGPQFFNVLEKSSGWRKFLFSKAQNFFRNQKKTITLDEPKINEYYEQLKSPDVEDDGSTGFNSRFSNDIYSSSQQSEASINASTRPRARSLQNIYQQLKNSLMLSKLPSSNALSTSEDEKLSHSSLDSGKSSLDEAKSGYPNQGKLSNHRSTKYILLKSIPIPLRSLFFQYTHLWNALMSHYASFDVIWAVCVGDFINDGPVLQYSMLPEIEAKYFAYKK